MSFLEGSAYQATVEQVRDAREGTTEMLWRLVGMKAVLVEVKYRKSAPHGRVEKLPGNSDYTPSMGPYFSSKNEALLNGIYDTDNEIAKLTEALAHAKHKKELLEIQKD